MRSEGHRSGLMRNVKKVDIRENYKNTLSSDSELNKDEFKKQNKSNNVTKYEGEKKRMHLPKFRFNHISLFPKNLTTSI